MTFDIINLVVEVLEKFVPDIYQKSIYDINYDTLKKRGIKCLIFDSYLILLRESNFS